MIQATDLRIGNWTFMKSQQKYFQIGNGNDIDNCEDLEPIELTSDIISKTNFYYDLDSESFQISDCTLKLYDYDDDGFMCVIFGNESHFINHLHQLQNLYFALTNEELEINL